jgi:hypothetical protein
LRKLRFIKPVFLLRHTIRLTGPRPFEVNFVPSRTTVIRWIGENKDGLAIVLPRLQTTKKPAGWTGGF